MNKMALFKNSFGQRHIVLENSDGKVFLLERADKTWSVDYSGNPKVILQEVYTWLSALDEYILSREKERLEIRNTARAALRKENKR